MSDIIKVLAVGDYSTEPATEDDVDNLKNIRDYLLQKSSVDKNVMLPTMINKLECLIETLSFQLYQYNTNKEHSLQSQKLIKSKGKFICFKDYLSIYINSNNYYNGCYDEIIKKIFYDKHFPENECADLKSYCEISKYVFLSELYCEYDRRDIRDLYREYQAVMQGRDIPI
jgi:hypothetical protein